MYLAVSEQASGIGSLGLDIKSIIFQMIAFILVVLILKKFALNQLFEVIDARRNELKAGLERSEQAKLELEKANKRAELIYAEARNQAELITIAAREEAQAMAFAIEKKAHEKASRNEADVREQLAQDVARVRGELKSEAAKLVAAATSLVLDQKLDSRRDRDLIEAAISRESKS
jgi:F-type H+-transporting ATPase subunit b